MDNEQRILWKNVFITFYGDWIGRPCDNYYCVNSIEEYALIPKGRLNPGLDDSYGENDEINKLKDEQVLIYKKLNSTRSILHKEMVAHVNCLNEKDELENLINQIE